MGNDSRELLDKSILYPGLVQLWQAQVGQAETEAKNGVLCLVYFVVRVVGYLEFKQIGHGSKAELGAQASV
ncbi:hypothetical protein BpHYR1_012449 [Brachionus plicatilis]|uniref:Uncharacterized protein n=1 Tax=Brachionus plicatilis TaxID=10195 RepID=A0A3M7P3K9_BRAPC|nr:hypothetical protein BpHYR1_012449 [Brachionus plicatilis]